MHDLADDLRRDALFNDTGLIQHPRFAAWIDTVVGGYGAAR
jgi:hypothetical protein